MLASSDGSRTMKIVHEAVLLGWMERDPAVEFLRKSCIFNPPLSQSKGRSLWEKYHRAVERLDPRDGTAPHGEQLNEAEKKAAESLLAAYKSSDNVLDVVKI